MRAKDIEVGKLYVVERGGLWRVVHVLDKVEQHRNGRTTTYVKGHDYGWRTARNGLHWAERVGIYWTGTVRDVAFPFDEMVLDRWVNDKARRQREDQAYREWMARVEDLKERIPTMTDLKILNSNSNSSLPDVHKIEVGSYRIDRPKVRLILEVDIDDVQQVLSHLGIALNRKGDAA